MSTRCLIARPKPDGHIESIYCHHDGYPSGVGATLASHYVTPESIDAIFALGNLSSLEETPEKCCAYARDRNEPIKDNLPRTHHSAYYLIKAGDRCDAEYIYLLSPDGWTVRRRCSSADTTFTEVTL